MKKKLFTFALCIIMVAAIAVPAFAAEPPQWSEGDTTVIDLTYEEFIKKTAELRKKPYSFLKEFVKIPKVMV
jgi:hypothetical protein